MAFRLITPSRKWLDITHLVTLPVASGRVLFQRDGHERTIALDGLLIGEEQRISGTFLVVTSEMGRPAFTQDTIVRGISQNLQITAAGNVQGFWGTVGTPVHGRLTYSVEGVA